MTSGTRRDLLAWTASAAGIALVPGCATCPPSGLPQTLAEAPEASFIDAHCHLFNRKDLSVVRFITEVILEQYPGLAEMQALRAFTPDDPTVLDRIVEILLAIVGADLAPTARAEAALLKAKRTGGVAATSVEEDDEILTDTRRNLVEFLGGTLPLPENRTLAPDVQRAAEDELLVLLYRAGATRRQAEPVTPQFVRQSRREHEEIARNLLDPPRGFVAAGDLEFPAILTFIGLFRRHRHCLLEKLTAIHRSQSVGTGQPFNPQLLAPAMVDYGCWLRDEPDPHSTFTDQVEVWAEIALRDGGPAVHGYVAFDPLRQALFKAGRLSAQRTSRDEPMAVVRRAVMEKGFLGVKLYPPMGFRAAGNEQRDFREFPFSKDVLTARFGTADPVNSIKLGRELDAALKELFGFCGKHHVPIMAHGGNSVAATPCSGRNADPWYWRPVLDGADAPPVMLAHFGGFDQRTSDPQGGGPASGCKPNLDTPLEQTWEVSVARYVQSCADAGRPCQLYADISMFTEVFAKDRARVESRFRQIAERYPAMRDHLIFGTDWSMLAQRNRAVTFTHDVYKFLETVWGRQGWDVRDAMRRNFLRYARLASDGPSRERVARVYDVAAPDRRARLRARLEAATA